MGGGNLELNKPPMAGLVQCIMLQKDTKIICRTRCSDLPFKVPACWIINEFRANSLYQQLELPRCQLYPYFEDRRQENEWGNFLGFLWRYGKSCSQGAAAFTFWLLMNVQNLHILVLYKMRREPPTCDDGEIESLGETHNVLGRFSQSFNQHNFSENSPGKLRPARRLSVTSSNNDFHPKSFIKTDPSYLRTLSQAHAGWVFGAMAELIDNSRDANASRLCISLEYLYSKQAGEKIPVLSFGDDGDGMSHVDIVRMISFGHKQPDEVDKYRIGRFGIGFKTGAMKLGRDVLVLTQTLGSRSVAFLSQSYNEHKENLEIPIITYRKQGGFMEVDVDVQSESSANSNLKAIKEFSPFNEYLIGERLGFFGEMRTGTQIYIWNLDKWGSAYTLEWVDDGMEVEGSKHRSQGDILIRSRRVRSRPGQISQKVPLDYSLQAYLEVIFLDPRMKIYVQGPLVKSRPLAKSLSKTVVLRGNVMGKTVELTLGRSQIEWKRMNCGIFLYWHGRLIEAYKRVGGMIHNADIGRGVIGVTDVSTLMDGENGHVWVLNNKQGFQDSEVFAKLEQWLGSKVDEYWDEHFDRVDLGMWDEGDKPDHEWVQCNKCRKWRILTSGFDSNKLPSEWFCYMSPFYGKCDAPEQQLEEGVVTVAAKRSHYESKQSQAASPKAKYVSPIKSGRVKYSSCDAPPIVQHTSDGDSEEASITIKDGNCQPEFKRHRSGPSRML